MTKVTLRNKPISGGRQALYLDYYPPVKNPETGKLTRREFLKLYLYNETEHHEERYTDSEGKPQRRFVVVLDKKGQPKKGKLSPIEKQHNQETLALAESIKGKRQLSIQRGNYGFLSDDKRKANFLSYFETLMAKRTGSSSDSWQSAYNYLNDYAGGYIQFKEITEHFCNGFKEYLLKVPSKRSTKTKLAQNSAAAYFNKFKVAIKEAFRDGYLETDINSRISTIKPAETERQYLTHKELSALAKAECSIPVLKQAALFSALTSLRFSDIQKLTWSNIHISADGGYVIHFRQRKTKGVEALPISDDAYKLLGEPKEGKELVFEGLKYSAWLNTQLQKWVSKAEIKKDITFHCFRHTYATLQITMGTDLYTVSKLLGHRDLKTTQVYARVIDKTKTDAANKMTLM